MNAKRSAKARLLAVVATAVAAVVAATPADAAAPIACVGTVNLTGISNAEAREAGPQTFVSFDFTGTRSGSSASEPLREGEERCEP